MIKKSIEVVVAGHICLDILPDFTQHTSKSDMLVPGKLTDVGPATLAIGGAVANAGLALHRLGISTRLVGKVGDDYLGGLILQILREADPSLAREMLVTREAGTSYSIVVSLPDVDRVFFHHTGANDVFRPTDLHPEEFRDARLFHVGYPPLLRQMYADGGQTFAALLRELKAYGLTTALDMALPDPRTEASLVNWNDWLSRVLPHVDLFFPTSDEILTMLGYTRDGAYPPLSGELLAEISERLLAKGAGIVALKLGSDGLYMRTTGELRRLASLGRCMPSDLRAWQERELLVPCFQVEVAGTTGAGDCTIAGYLAGLLRQLAPEEVMTGAVAVGAFSVEAADATSGVPAWDTVQARVERGWPRLPLTLDLPGWRYDETSALWRGPHDRV
ncbi:MAG TPA: carbohydrate kinase family protein [Ktedonobacteraceae bacterium]